MRRRIKTPVAAGFRFFAVETSVDRVAEKK